MVESLRVKRGDIVAFIGAGGKTTLMFRLGTELAKHGQVLITTTTKIYRPGASFVGGTVLAPTLEEAVAELGERWQETDVVVLGAGEDHEQKLQGIPVAWVAEIKRAFPQCIVLVEADGAAGRLLKGHLPHEPVVPGAATLVVTVTSLAVLRKTLDATSVHRPEVVAAVAGVALGISITPLILARAVERGVQLAKGQAPLAKNIVWLNTGLGHELAAGNLLAEGRMVARYLAPQSVVIGEARSLSPVQEVWPPDHAVVGVVLAAGLSRRLNGEKLLLPWQGKALVRHSVEALLGSRLDKVVVVVGHRGEEVQDALVDLPVEVVDNKDYRAGIGLSVRAAVAHVEKGMCSQCRGILFALGDQPCLRGSTVDALLGRFLAREGAIVYPLFAGKRGNPVIFPAALYGELLLLQGDTGGQEVMSRHKERLYGVVVDDQAVIEDIDCREDYVKLVENRPKVL